MLNFYHHTPLHHSSPVVAFNKPLFVYTLNVEKRPKLRRKGVFFEAIFKAANLKAHKTLRLVASLLGADHTKSLPVWFTDTDQQASCITRHM